MLIAIVPLQSPEASRDWQRVSALARRTITSLLNMTGEFRLILVCNQPPSHLPQSSALDVIECDLPVPAPNTPSRMSDKWLKVRIGLAAARRWMPAHIMIADADDCVSSRLGEFVSRNSNQQGWYFDEGYFYTEGRSFLIIKNEFHRHCGTSAIVRCEAAELPRDVYDDSCILTRFGHTAVVDEFARLGRPLEPLPFRGAVYVTGTGENDSGISYRSWDSRKRFVRELVRHRLLTPRLRQEFNLTPLIGSSLPTSR